MSTSPIPGYEYNVGGGLDSNAPSYVVRQADQEFYTALKAGKFCYVFNSRQMGKSSLRNRTAQQLRAEGIACGVVELSQVGSHGMTEAGWYQGIVGRIRSSLRIRFQHLDWWREREDIPPLQRFLEFIETILLVEITQPIVLFIDEIDRIFEFDFKDDFFALIRSFHEQRTEQPEYKRLTFALLGVATPSDLIQDKRHTPFNIGQAIALEGFNLHEVQPLIPGLIGKTENPEGVLRIILAWTGGQPFLVQRLCQLVRTSPNTIVVDSEAVRIEQLVRSRILENWESQDSHEHLKSIRDRLVQDEGGRLLGLGQQVVQQGEISADDSSEQAQLRLTGLVVKQQGKLRIYNRIYAEVFNLSWFEQQLGKLRPYANEINAWVASNHQDESRLLRGQALQEALAWASGQSLPDEDYRFLNASQEVEQRVVQEENRILNGARRVAENKTKKANRRLVWSALFAFVLVSLALLFSFKAQQAAIAAQSARDQAKKEAIAAQRDRDLAQQKEIAFQKQARDAEEARNSAESELGIALKEKKAATNERDKTKHETTIAEQQRREAEKQKIEAQRLADQAIAERQRAQRESARAQREASITREGISLERLGFSILQQFRAGAFAQFRIGELENFLEIMKSGKKLHDLVKNESASLEDYPAVSPQFALQMVLDNIKLRERNQLGSSDSREIPRSVSFSPDLQYLATGGYDGTVQIWTQSGQLLATWNSGHGQVLSISFSPKQPILATTGSDGMVRLWNLSGGTSGSPWKAHPGAVRGISFSPDGKQLATGGQDGKVRLWDLSGNQQTEWQAHPAGTVVGWTDFPAGVSVSFDPKGQRLVTASFTDTTVRLWDLAGIPQDNGFKVNNIVDVNFSPGGEHLVTAENDFGVAIRDLSGTALNRFEASAWTASLSPNGQRLALISSNRARILDLVPQSPIHPEITWQVYDDWAGGGGWVVSLNSDGTILSTLRGDGKLRIWNLSNPRNPLAEFDNISAAKFDRQGQRLAIGNHAGLVQIWNSAGTQKLIEWNAHQNALTGLGFSRDGQRLVTNGNDGIIRIWDLSKRMPEELLHWNGGKYAVLSRDGQHIATQDGSLLRVWDTVGHKLKEWRVPSRVIGSMDFSPNGELIVTAGHDFIAPVRLWNLSGEEQARIIPPGQTRIEQATFSPDGQLIATAGIDATARLWTISGQQVAQFETGTPESRYWVTGVAFTPDGKSLAIADAAYRQVRLRQIETLDQLLERGCNWLREYLAVHPNAPKICPGQEGA